MITPVAIQAPRDEDLPPMTHGKRRWYKHSDRNCDILEVADGPVRHEPSKSTFLNSRRPARRPRTVRDVDSRNLPKGYEEGMLYGLIGYYVPHSLFPRGITATPTSPVLRGPGLAEESHGRLPDVRLRQRSTSRVVSPTRGRKTGKKLDMGKSCVRFKKVDDLALDVIGEAMDACGRTSTSRVTRLC
jgi:hypothetical protein